MYKQIIIARKDLDMSPGKLAAQVSHASIAFLTNAIKKNFEEDINDEKNYYLFVEMDEGVYDNWINESFTKVVLRANSKTNIDKAVNIAESLGMVKDVDYFLIHDSCRTELTPEFIDEDGIGRVTTCIGFKPMPEEIINIIGKKFQMY